MIHPGEITQTRSMNNLLVQYSYLQLLDFLSTLAFLLNGVLEANPFVRLAMWMAPNALVGLLSVKLLALGLGVYCWMRGKYRLLGRINMMFALLIAWNLVALIFAGMGVR